MGNRKYWIFGVLWLGMVIGMPWGVSAQEENFTEKVNGVEFEMIYVKGGTFMMGATEEQGLDAKSDEYPVHEVTLSDYYIGKYEVTAKLWKAVMSYGGEQSNYPEILISWENAREFCRKLSQLTGRRYTLPTEAQWEYAARGGNGNKKIIRVWCGDGTVVFSSIISPGTKYSGSDNINEVGWYVGNSGIWEGYGRYAHPVGTKQPNALGIYDMSGNAWEWCSDWYGSYSSESQSNPTGPSTGSYRVLRGGSWYDSVESCRVSNRFSFRPDRMVIDDDNNHYRLGLRLVLLP